MGMQLLVAEVAARFAIVLLVDSDDIGVLVALTDGFASVFAIDGFHTFADDIAVAVVIGLTSTADATTGASHDLNEMIAIGIAFADLFHEFAGIAKAVSHSNLQGEAIKVDGSFLDAFETTGFFEIDFGKSLACVEFVGGTQSSFHNTTGSTKDDTGTSGLTQRIVEVLFGHVVEVEVALTDHVSQLTGAEHEVDIRISVYAEFLTSTLTLLGEAGHNRNHNEVFTFHTQLGGEIVLGNSAEHTLRRLGG